MTPTLTITGDKPWALSTLPPFPAVARKVLEELSKEDFELKRVVHWIESDPAFTAELLRVANSALYGFSYEIQSVHHAAITLGADFVKALAMTVAMRTYLKTALRLPILRRCWRHSLATAVLAGELSAASRQATDTAYTAGLLHDIGRMGLLAAYPAEYANLLSVSAEHSFDLLHCENELFDIDHCAAGAWLAKEWKLPAELVKIAAHHHEEPTEEPSILNTIRMSCRLADSLGFSVIQERSTDEYLTLMAKLSPEARAKLPECYEDLKNKIVTRIDALN
jgi:putative nucleotidyltransferase with HDIG domain